MDYEKAASYWEAQEVKAVRMEQCALYAEMRKFIEAHNTCALATGCGDFVRCTPIEYSFKDGKFWLLTEGGLKFHALKDNKNVCLAIFDSFTGFGKLGGMQVTGKAECIEPMSEEYLELLKYRNLNAENLKKLPHELYLICVTPVRIDFLWSKFKDLGCNPRQYLIFPLRDSENGYAEEE